MPFGRIELRAEPEPLHERGQRGRQTLHHQGGQAGTQQGQRGKQPEVAEAEADHAARHENRQPRTVQSAAVQVRPHRQHYPREPQTGKIRGGYPYQSGGPMGENRGQRKEKRGKESGEHGRGGPIRRDGATVKEMTTPRATGSSFRRACADVYLADSPAR